MTSVQALTLHFLSKNIPYLVLVLVIGLLAAAWAYHRTLAPLSPRLRILLWSLRAVALLLLVFMLLQPILGLLLRSGDKPRLVLLVDRSGSMAFPGGTGEPRYASSFERAGHAEERLKGSFALERRVFASTVGPVSGGWSGLRPVEGAPTAIGAALREVLESDPEHPVGGIVLVSDGISTVGPDPVDVARRYRVPIYPLLPEASEVRDALIAQVLSNPVAYLKNELPVQITVKGIGSEGEVVRVRLKEEGRVLAEREVALGAGGALRDVRLSFVPDVPGTHFYEAEVSALEGEATDVNNHRHFAVDVREEKTRVLVIEGRLSWDFTFVKRALERDTTLAYTYLVRGGSGWRSLGEERVTRPPADLAGLKTFSAVLLGDVGPGDLSGSQWQALATFVDGGGGLIALGGRSAQGIGRLRGTALGAVLPVRGGGGEPGDLTIALAPAGRSHPVTAIADEPAENDRLWDGLPPVAAGATPLEPVSGADVLLAGEADGRPVLVAGRYGRGKTLVFGAHSFWRWGFQPPALEVAGNDLHDWLWLQAIRWAVEPYEVSRVNVLVNRPVLERGEEVSFSATVYDERFRALEGAEVVLALNGEGVEREVRLAPTPAGYGASAGILAPGAYRFAARALLNGREIGRDDGRFLVDEMGPEFLELAPDRGLLTTLAEESGGRAFEANAIGTVGSAIPRTVRVVERTREYELATHPALFIAFVGALTGEWFLRRRNGLA